MAEQFTPVLGSDLRIIFSFPRPFLSWLSQMKLVKEASVPFQDNLTLVLLQGRSRSILKVTSLQNVVPNKLQYWASYLVFWSAVWAWVLWSAPLALYWSTAEFHSDCYPQGTHEEEIRSSWDYPTEQRNEINNTGLLVLSSTVAHRAFQGSVRMG